jgi:hypothetical protein
MRLNESTYPSYITLEKKDFARLKIDQMFGESLLDTNDKFYNFLTALQFTYSQVANKYYITNTFKEAILTAAPKISNDNKHHINIPTDCGIIFTDKGFTIYLSSPNDKKLKLLCFGFTRDTLTTYGYVDNDLNFGGIACSIKDGKPYNDVEGLTAYLDTTLLALYFIHNCEIDTKVIKPNEKYRNNGNKYFNESKSDITILDCRWFTDLIRDIPFKVKGHLRWQVHGEKRGKRKLIWISDYEKTGYVRQAQKTQTI